MNSKRVRHKQHKEEDDAAAEKVRAVERKSKIVKLQRRGACIRGDL